MSLVVDRMVKKFNIDNEVNKRSMTLTIELLLEKIKKKKLKITSIVSEAICKPTYFPFYIGTFPPYS